MDRKVYSSTLHTIANLASHVEFHGTNPHVGAAIFAPGYPEPFIGVHHGDGTPHAEVEAIKAYEDAVPADTRRLLHGKLTALVTLEPCSHYGKTPPCTGALLNAGVGTLYYAADDPNPPARGGAAVLRDAGVTVRRADAVCTPDSVATARAVTTAWRYVVTHHRPWVIAKVAQTLDGYVAAPDGTSTWITGPAARDHAHVIRAQVDAIMVGTGTVMADDPSLTARRPDGTLRSTQPVKVVVGNRDIPATATINNPPAAHVYHTHDLADVIVRLYKAGHHYILIEGGPTVVSAAIRDHLVNELHTYIAPTILGDGRKSITLPNHTLTDATNATITHTRRVGDDLFVRLLFTTEKDASCSPD